ncbi:universal stress protein [Sungkyunkwania multivorans]|uniref:Universal stress protein n=1 Tax=Sungkyunkwania multivorans TaxID=1173618 RepID=A0ABW3D1Y3_9FLAO
MIHILLPTDFSENAWNAMNYAVYLFEKEQCIFYVLHSYQVSPSGLTSKINKERDTRLYQVTKEEHERALENWMQRLEVVKSNPRHNFKGLSVASTLVNAVGSATMKYNIDYIFMGTQGATGAKEVFMGSNTVGIIKNIDVCPIVAVPSDYDYDVPDDIMFATDFKRYFEEVEIKPLIDMARLWNSRIRVVHIDEEQQLSNEQQRNKDLLKQRLKGISHIFEDVEPNSNISKVINAFADKANIGMVAMVNNKHSFFEKLTHEPVIKRIAFKTNVPFLVLPEIV